MKTLYHLRAPNGVTVDLTEAPRHIAMEQARVEGCEVYELNGSVATRIYTPPVMSPVKLEK